MGNIVNYFPHLLHVFELAGQTMNNSSYVLDVDDHSIVLSGLIQRTLGLPSD
jgi:hypothetical protein